MYENIIDPSYDQKLFELRSQDKNLSMYEDMRRHSYDLVNWIETFTYITGRSIEQTYELYYYLRGNINKLINLEINLISNYISDIPRNNARIHSILKMGPNKDHPKYNELLHLEYPWFHHRNRYLYTIADRTYISETLGEYKKRGLTIPTYALYENEPLSCIKNRLIASHADNLQYIIKDNKIVYNHVLHTSLERTHKKYRLNMITINQEGFENYKTFSLTHSVKDKKSEATNEWTHLLSVGCLDSNILHKEDTSALISSILNKSLSFLFSTRTNEEFLMSDYDDNNTFLDILDEFSLNNNTWLKVLNYKSMRSITGNNQFIKVDYLPKGNYYAASGIFTKGGKDAELSAEEAGKLVLSHIVYERPLALREELLSPVIKQDILNTITKEEFAKLKSNATDSAIKQCKKRIDKRYDAWLNKVILTRQKIAFDYPIRSLTIKEFMDEHYINLVKVIYV